MPHQCVHCNTFYPDGSDVILQGCTKCSGKLFFFIRENKLKEAKKLTQSLSDDEKRQIEKGSNRTRTSNQQQHIFCCCQKENSNTNEFNNKEITATTKSNRYINTSRSSSCRC